MKACENRVRSLCKLSKESGSNKLPLIRLRVEFSSNGFDTFSNLTFGQKFRGIVANPNEIINFTKSSTAKANVAKGKEKFVAQEQAFEKIESHEQGISNDMIYGLVEGYISKFGGFGVLDIKSCVSSLKEFIEKEENSALSERIENDVTKTCDSLKNSLQKYANLESSDFFDSEIIDTTRLYEKELKSLRNLNKMSSDTKMPSILILF